MKTPVFIMIVAFTTTFVINAQKYTVNKKSRYGIEISQFITGSGFASGTELYFKVIPENNKKLSFGIFFCNEQKKISGITMHHEIGFLKNTSRSVIIPYAFYNLIYRFTRVNIEDTDNVNNTGLYKSLEHHLGVGINVNLSKSMYVKSGLGYGVYFGSIKKNTKSDITGEMYGSNGFGVIGKIGIVYIF